MPDNKKCNICKCHKPLEEFFKSSCTKDGRSSRCKECCGVASLYKRNYEPSNLKTYAEYMMTYHEISKKDYNK